MASTNYKAANYWQSSKELLYYWNQYIETISLEL